MVPEKLNKENIIPVKDVVAEIKPTPNPYTKKVYENLLDAFGQDHLPTYEIFSQKISDPKYRYAVRENLLDVYGPGNVPDLKSFNDSLNVVIPEKKNLGEIGGVVSPLTESELSSTPSTQILNNGIDKTKNPFSLLDETRNNFDFTKNKQVEDVVTNLGMPKSVISAYRQLNQGYFNPNPDPNNLQSGPGVYSDREQSLADYKANPNDFTKQLNVHVWKDYLLSNHANFNEYWKNIEPSEDKDVNQQKYYKEIEDISKTINNIYSGKQSANGVVGDARGLINLQNDVEKASNYIKQYVREPGDQEKALIALGNSSIDIFGNNEELEEYDQKPLGKYLNSYQSIGLNYLRRLDRGKAEFFEKYKDVDPSKYDNFGGYFNKLGYEKQAKQLDELGAGIHLNWAQNQLNELDNRYKQQGNYLDPEDVIKYGKVLESANKAQEYLNHLAEYYPDVIDADSRQIAQDYLGYNSGVWGTAGSKLSYGFANLGQSVYDLAAAPFRSKEEIDEAALFASGFGDYTSVQTMPRSDIRSDKTGQFIPNKELLGKMEEIKNSNLEPVVKAQKISNLIQNNRDKYTFIPPDGGYNWGAKMIFSSTLNFAADLAPFILQAYVTRGAGGSSMLGRFSNMFGNVLVTSYEQELARAVNENNPNPESSALANIFVNALAYEAAGVGTKSISYIRNAAGKMGGMADKIISKLDDATIKKMLDNPPRNLKTFMTDLGKASLKTAGEGAQGALAFEAILGGKKYLETGEFNLEESALNALNFTLFHTVAGTGSEMVGLNSRNKNNLYQAALDVDNVIFDAKKALAEGKITEQKHNQIIKNVEAASKVLERVPMVDENGKKLKDKDASELLYLKIKEQFIKDKLNKDIPEKLKQKYNKELSDNQQKIDKIYKGSLPQNIGKPFAGLAEGKMGEVPVTEVPVAETAGTVAPVQEVGKAPKTKEESVNKLIKIFVPKIEDPNFEITNWDKNLVNQIKNNPIEFIDNLLDVNKRELEENPQTPNAEFLNNLTKKLEDVKQNYLNAEKAEGKQEVVTSEKGIKPTDIEAQKADIERRRQEDLSKLPNKGNIEGDLITVKSNEADAIDAKYDKELKDLESGKAEVKPTEEIPEVTVEGLTEGYKVLSGDKRNKIGDIRQDANEARIAGKDTFTKETIKDGKKTFTLVDTTTTDSVGRPAYKSASITLPEGTKLTIEDVMPALKAGLKGEKIEPIKIGEKAKVKPTDVETKITDIQKNLDLANKIEKARSGDKKAQEELTKFGIKYDKNPIYRHVSESEVNALNNGEQIEGKFKNGRVDVTTNSKPSTGANAEYRITFNDTYDFNKGDKAKVKNEELGDGWIAEGGYNKGDVLRIEKRNEDGSYTSVYEGKNKTVEGELNKQLSDLQGDKTQQVKPTEVGKTENTEKQEAINKANKQRQSTIEKTSREWQEANIDTEEHPLIVGDKLAEGVIIKVGQVLDYRENKDGKLLGKSMPEGGIPIVTSIEDLGNLHKQGMVDVGIFNSKEEANKWLADRDAGFKQSYENKLSKIDAKYAETVTLEGGKEEVKPTDVTETIQEQKPSKKENINIKNIADEKGNINTYSLKAAIVDAPALINVNEKTVENTVGHLRQIADKINDKELNDTVAYLEDASNMLLSIKNMEEGKRNEFLSNQENFYSDKKPPSEVLKRLDNWAKVLKGNTAKNNAERLLKEQYQKVLGEIERRFVNEKQQPNRPKLLEAPEVKATKVKETIPVDLEERGEPIESTLEAERRRSNGERIFAVTEQDEMPVEVTSLEMLRNYTPDQLMSYKPIEEVKPTAEAKVASDLVSVSVAPYYDTQIKDISDASELRKSEGYKGHIQMLKKVAKTMGLEINSIDDTIGGFENEQGNKITEISNRVKLNTKDIDAAEKYAAVVGALAHETQEATIAARYVEHGDPNQSAIETELKVSDLNNAVKSLKEAGINSFEINENDNSIKILDFDNGKSKDFNNKMLSFADILDKNNVKYETEHHAIESRYVSPERRAELLKEAKLQAEQQKGGAKLRDIYEKSKAKSEEFLSKKELPVEIPEEVHNPIVDKIRKGIQKLSNKAKISVLKGKNFAKALEDAIKTGGANLQSWGGFEKKGFEESPEWKKLIDDNTVKLNFDLKGLEGKPVVVINPDNMLTGKVITKDGKPIVDGNGGINFVTKFGDVWASSDGATANTLARYINEARQKDLAAGGDGTVHVVVTKGDLSKSLTSHTGSKAAMKVLEHFVDKKLISLSDFRKALTDVGKKYNIDFDGRLDAKSIHDDIAKKFFGVTDSTFSKRGFFVQDVIDHLAKNSKSAKENIGKIREMLNTEALPKSTERKTGEISFAKEGIVDAIGHLLSDNITVGVKNSEAYATIEIKHPVEVFNLNKEQGGHESYPFHLRQIDKNGNKIKPVLNVLTEAQHVTDVLNDVNNKPVDKKGGAGKFGSNQIGMARGFVKAASEHPSGVNMMTDATGKIYGFEKNGKIVLNADLMNGNTPFHEAGHLWLSWAKENRSDLHEAGMTKIEGSKYLQDVKNNPVYQENASKLPELERDAYFKSEALAKAIGDNGEQFVNSAKKADFKQWLKDLWTSIADQFGLRDMTAEQISDLTLDEFSKKVVSDIVGKEKGMEKGLETEGIVEPAKMERKYEEIYKDLTNIEKRQIINSKFEKLLEELKIEKICPTD
jgi:hypothetical protein